MYLNQGIFWQFQILFKEIHKNLITLLIKNKS